MNEDSIIEDHGIVTLSQKNCPQLFYFGQYFRIINNSNGRCKWRCVKPSCNVRCITNGCSVGEKYVVEKDNDDPKSHSNHASDPIRFSQLEKRRKMREIAQNSEEAPSRIISKCADQILNEEAIAQSSTSDSDRQFITRIKKAKKQDYSEISQAESLNEITFPTELTKTYDEDDFLLHDSGVDDVQRFFIFGTSINLKLIENNHIFMDGSFDVAPTLFYQVYSIHVLLSHKCYPVAYAILPKKTQKIYENFLSCVEKKLESHPLSINCDFDKAMVNAAQKVFPRSPIYGCFFHLNQSIWRNIQKSGLESAYNSMPNVRKMLKFLIVLSYLPLDDVCHNFDDYKKRLDLEDPVQAKINSVYEYFEETYVGKLSQVRNGRGRNKLEEIRSKPHFQIELWNIHSRLISDIPWTTNLVESWHNAFCRILTSHSCVYDLVEWLRKEQKKTNDNLLKLKTGVTINRNQEKLNVDKRVRELLKQYSRDNFDTFFESLSLIIKY